MKVSAICREVEKTMDGIFRSYRLDAVNVDRCVVTAKVTNTWKDKEESFVFGFLMGTCADGKEYLDFVSICKVDASTQKGIGDIITEKIDDLFYVIQKEHDFDSGDLFPCESRDLEEISERLTNLCMSYIETRLVLM